MMEKRTPTRTRVDQAGTAGIERGGRLSDTRLFTTPPYGGLHFGCREEFATEVRHAGDSKKSALTRFDDGPAEIIQTARGAGSWLRIRSGRVRFSLDFILKLLNIVQKRALSSLGLARPAVNEIKESHGAPWSLQPRLIRRHRGFHSFLMPYRLGREPPAG
jgi:hypothetical protein